MGVWDWIVTLFSHWQYWASGGGLGGAVLLILNLLQGLRGWKMNKLWQVVLFLVLFVIGASYMAWRDERKSVLDLQSTSKGLQQKLDDLTVPIFELEILQAHVSPIPSGHTQIVFVGDLKNKGADAAVIGNTWLAEIVTADGKTYKGSPALLTGTIDLCEGEKIRRFVPEDALDLKASDVIKTNGYKLGALGWTFPVDKNSVLNQQTAFKISAEAVRGTRLTFTESVGELMMHSGESVYLPGLKFPALLDKQTAGPSPCNLHKIREIK